MITEYCLRVTNGIIGGWYATRQTPCYSNNFTVYPDGTAGFDRTPTPGDRKQLVQYLNRKPNPGDYLELGRGENFTYIRTAVKLVRLGVWEVLDENGCAFQVVRYRDKDNWERAAYQTLSEKYTL